MLGFTIPGERTEFRNGHIIGLGRAELLALIRAARQEVIDAVIAEHPVEWRGGLFCCLACDLPHPIRWVTDPLDRCATVRALRPWIKEEA
jgi:hypothetical protein